MNIDTIDFEDYNTILRAFSLWTEENADDLINGPFEEDNDEDFAPEFGFVGVTEFREDVVEIQVVCFDELVYNVFDTDDGDWINADWEEGAPYTLLVSYEDLQMYVDLVENLDIEFKAGSECVSVG